MLKICAWDFDKTITKEETRGFVVFNSVEEKAQYLKDIPNKIRNLERLKRLFMRMHQAGIILAVVSFAVKPTIEQVKELKRYKDLKDLPLTDQHILGGKELILAYLDAAFGKDRPFLLANDIIAYRFSNTLNKYQHLVDVMNQHQPGNSFLPTIKNNEVMLVDDNQDNVEAANEQGFMTCKVEQDNDDYLDDLEQQVDCIEEELLRQQVNNGQTSFPVLQK